MSNSPHDESKAAAAMSALSDAELMNEVRGGRTGALAELFERHHAALYRFCLRMVGDRHAAEDLVQEVFMRMLKYRKTFQDQSAFGPWMFRIARNASVDYLRHAGHEPHADVAVDEMPAATSTEAEVAGQMRDSLIHRALAALPATGREVILLSRFEFKTYEEIAHVLDCSVGAVKVRAHRAIKQLREIYQSLAKEELA